MTASTFPTPGEISPSEARRFALLTTGLVNPHLSLAAALEHQGFVQIDPINVCGRMHEHILRTRVKGYAEGDLHQHLHGLGDQVPIRERTAPAGKRTAFEHFHPGRMVLCAFPLAAWPYLQAGMAARAKQPGQWRGKLLASERRVAERVLAEIEERGALSSLDIHDPTRSHNGWNHSRLVKVVMDKLFGHGRLLIARRQNGRRVYDLAERVLPSKIRRLSAARPSQVARWITELKLRQHRLVPLKRAELATVEDLVHPLKVDGCATLYCLRSDLALLEQLPEPPSEPRLIAPLDPLVLDRTVVKNLWNFDYTWEVYTPPAKRKRGYYALPLLAGERLVGHVDLKADRDAGKLRVVSRSCARGHRSAGAVKAVAEFLDLR